MKNIIKNRLSLLSAEEQSALRALSVISSEGIYMDVARNILHPVDHHAFTSTIDSLCNGHWLVYDGKLYCPEIVVETVTETFPIDTDTAIKILSSLKKYVTLRPLDDMLSKQQYFVVARLFLSYMLKQWYRFLPLRSDLKTLFCEVVIAFAGNAEISYTTNRKPVNALEYRLDFRLLDLVRHLKADNYCEGQAYLLLGKLYTYIFRYEEAKKSFSLAENYLKDNEQLFLARAYMQEMLGVYGKAFQYAWRAYHLNRKDGDNDSKIETALYIAYLCGVCQSYESCKYWRKVARSLIGNKAIPANHIFSIRLGEIEALLHIGDQALATQIIDGVELKALRLFGPEAPEMGQIAFLRCLIDNEAGLLREYNHHYNRYVEINHYNFGYSTGDTAILYSSIIDTNIIWGNHNTANIFTNKLLGLHADGPTFSPGVRMSQAFAKYSSSYAEEDYDQCKAYVDDAKKIYHEELRLSEKVIKEITSIFTNGIIPDCVLSKDVLRYINIEEINIFITEGRTKEARQRIKLLAAKETDAKERLIWYIHLGRCFMSEGRQDEGLKIWEETIRSASNKYKFEIAKEAAEWASEYNLTYEAKNLYEEALEPEAMVYARTCELAVALQDYADSLERCGLKDRSDEHWKQAEMLLVSSGDRDSVAILHFFWGIAKQDQEAETHLLKAIESWLPEPYSYDEMLSRIFYFLCQAQAMQGKHEAARDSARKAVDYFPTEFPSDWFEDIKEYLY